MSLKHRLTPLLLSAALAKAENTGAPAGAMVLPDGRVAAVTEAGQAAGNLAGIVTRVEDGAYTDQNGNSYTAKTVHFTATDGTSYSYPVDAKSTFKAGSLVQVTLTSGGEAQISRLSQSSVSGKVNAGATKLGNTPISDEVEILDVNGDGAFARIYPSRLAGMTLSSKQVKYVRRNTAGEIDRLILDDVTGDLYSYGVLTTAKETSMVSMGMLTGTYIYDVAGTSYTYTNPTGIFNLSTGPVKIQGSLYAPEKMFKLSSAKLSSVDALTAVTAEGSSIPVSDGVAVYELENSTYRLSSLERIRTGYTLTGYYDKSAAEGGRIRVIVAKPN